jgi:hypothetical protein
MEPALRNRTRIILMLYRLAPLGSVAGKKLSAFNIFFDKQCCGAASFSNAALCAGFNPFQIAY